MKFKQISAVLASVMLIGLTAGGVVSAANYPQPFVVGNTGQFAVVYGATGATSDQTQATNIAQQLQAMVTGTVGVGDESVNIGEESASDLLLGRSLNILTDITDYELPTILQERTIKTNDADIKYHNLLTIGNNLVSFDNLGDEENYLINTHLAENLEPVLHVAMNNEAWTLEIEFEDPLDATNLRPGERLYIAGTEWSVDPGMSSGDQTLILFGASQSEVVGYQETVTFNIDGQSYSITVTGGVEDPDRIHVEIGGQTFRNLEEGDSFEYENQKFIINEIAITTIGSPVPTIEAEIFAGAHELEIIGDSPYSPLVEVDVNGEVVRGLYGNFTGANVSNIEYLHIQFKPKNMDAERDEHNYLEIGRSIVDPVFGTIALSFDSASQGLKEDKEYFHIDASRSDDVRLTLTNDEGREYNFVAYKQNSTKHLLDNVILSGSLNNLTRTDHEKKILILEERQSSRVLEIDRVDGGRPTASQNTVRFKDLSTGETFTVEHGKTFMRNEYDLVFYNSSGDVSELGDASQFKIRSVSGGADVTAIDVFKADNDVNVTLGSMSSNSTTITIAEPTSTDYTETDLVFTVDNNNDQETQVVYTSGTVQGSVDDEGEYGYWLTQFGSYIETEVDDNYWVKVWVPEEMVEYNVYIGSAGEATTPELGNVLVTDANVEAVQGRNLIVVGGSCVNTVARRLIDPDATSPVCTDAWTSKTGVGSGHLLIQSFENPYQTGRIALLVAGYEAAETVSASQRIINKPETIDTTVGNKYVFVRSESTEGGITIVSGP